MKTSGSSPLSIKWDGKQNVESGLSTHHVKRVDYSLDGIPYAFLDKAALNSRKGQSNFDQSVVHMQLALFSYSKVLLKTMLDVVPKLAWSELVARVEMQFAAFVKGSIGCDGSIDVLMTEENNKAVTRKKLEVKIERFTTALRVLRGLK